MKQPHKDRIDSVQNTRKKSLFFPKGMIKKLALFAMLW